MKQEKFFKEACEIYAAQGVDVESALNAAAAVEISIHAWQGDDVMGFESDSFSLTGGCQVTGNYPGRARTADELRKDLDFTLDLVPGAHRVGLQGHQVDKMVPGVDRDGFTIENFSRWLDWAKEKKLHLDLAPAFYGHEKLIHNLSLSHPDREISKFWIDHGIACRKIGEIFGKELGSPCICNFWAPDGFKDTPVDRYGARQRLMDALDECFDEPISEEYERDAVEAKLFGIGCESCTVGSHEFYMLYGATRGKMLCFDSGHFHPTEVISDKLSAYFCMMDEVLLHVSRGVRWDSDHVVVLNDELYAIAQEIIRHNYDKRVHIGLDYFDASINRIGAWAIGARAMQKALLAAALEPAELLRQAEEKGDNTSRLALMEDFKSLPFGAVWEAYCEYCKVPGFGWIDQVKEYEKNVLNKR